MSVDFVTRRFLRKLDEGLVLAGPDADLAAVARDLNGPGPAMTSVEDVTVGPAGEAVVRWLRPVADPRALVLCFLGFSVGARAATPEDADTVGRKLAERTLATVGLVGHPGPQADAGAVADAVLAAVRAEVARDGVDLPVVVVGEAWGATLAVRAARGLGDGAGMPRAESLFLVNPMTSTDAAELDDPDVGDVALLSRPDLVAAAPARPVDGLSGLDAAALAGLPSTHVLLAGLDPLLGQGASLVSRLRAAGVDVAEHTYPDQAHGFFGRLILPASELAFQLVVRATRAATVGRRLLAHSGAPVARPTATPSGRTTS